MHPSTWDFYFPVIQGFVNEMNARRFRIHLEINSMAELAADSELINYLRGYGIQGCAFIITTNGDYEVFHLIAEQYSIPVVTVYTRLFDTIPSVSIDNYEASHRVTTWLRRLGHSEIAFIGGLQSDSAAGDRKRGYVDAMEGLSARIFDGNWDFESGDAELRRMIARGIIPTALFCANDHMAMGALAACRDLRIDVPDRISLVGFDDTMMSRIASPSLTTVKMPLVEMGREAASTLLANATQGGTVEPLHRKLKAELIVRNSVIPFAPHGKETRSGSEETVTAQNT